MNLDQVLANVGQLRIMAAAAGPAWRMADAVDTTVGYDNIKAVPEPVSSVIVPLLWLGLGQRRGARRGGTGLRC
ncbi:MAG: hypothetical protein CMJ50_08595 [Planctomycetaceae bacterium]|nr:hypothetical protein [Planctomycetaceae bacterium]